MKEEIVQDRESIENLLRKYSHLQMNPPVIQASLDHLHNSFDAVLKMKPENMEALKKMKLTLEMEATDLFSSLKERWDSKGILLLILYLQK